MKKLLLALVALATIATTQATKYKTCAVDSDCGQGQVCRKSIVQGIGVEAREEYVCTPAGAELRAGAKFPHAEYVRDLA